MSLRMMVLLVSFMLLTRANWALAASNMQPDYEIKFLLRPELVLDHENKLTALVRDTFHMPVSVKKMAVLFVDTDAKSFYRQGWINRIRLQENESEFELSYKKRYAIENGNIDQALSLANSEGFSNKDSNYEAQIEWGYEKQTLSITNSKMTSRSGYRGMDLPNQQDAIAMLQKNLPGKIDDWLYKNWGSKQLASGRHYGPVLAKRSQGEFISNKIVIEVWPIRNSSGNAHDYLVEASVKAASYAQASSLRAQLLTYLIKRGWLLPQDSLKTQLILERY